MWIDVSSARIHIWLELFFALDNENIHILALAKHHYDL